jgi:4,5-DOPA dioxygenase extradiol
MNQTSRRMPAVFISHGSPMVAIEQGPYQQALAGFGEMVRPKAILVISAHWSGRDTVHISAAPEHSLIYDFGGFPPALYQLTYKAKGLPELGSRVAEMLSGSGFHTQLDPSRGLDHGVWVPLRLMYPKADIPVVEISLPLTMSPEKLYELGKALAPLRDDGVMILGSGGIVHNLRLFNPAERDGAPDAWAQEFDQWFRNVLEAHETSTLFNYQTKAPHAALAVPTPEHFVPVFVVLGAGAATGNIDHVFEGIQYGNMSMRCFAIQ